MQSITALVCLSPGELRLEKRPAPRPGAGELLVRPKRIGICGTDYHIFEGKHPFLKYPRIMGHELAVEVIDANGTSAFRVGDICAVNPYLSCGTCIACRKGKPNCCTSISVLGVHQDGGMQELLVVPESSLVECKGLSADGCAAVEFLAIGAHAVRRGAVSPQDNVLVIGAGPIGLGVALFAKLAGAPNVALADRDAERVHSISKTISVEPLLAGNTIDQLVADHTDGNGFDVVFDATGNQSSMQRGFDFVAAGGRYVLVSVVKDQITFSDPDFHRRELTLLGSRNATKEDFSNVISAIVQGRVPLGEIVTHKTDLAGAAGNLPLWAKQKSGLVKAMITVGD